MTRTCHHCGTEFPEGRGSGDFCCQGCAFVHGLIHREGLDRFYDLRDRDLDPVGSRVFQERDFSALQARQEQAEARAAVDGGEPELVVGVQGISCVGCVWLIDKVFEREAGALRIEVNAQSGQARMRWRAGAFSIGRLAEALNRFGYTLGPATSGRSEASRGLVVRLGLCGFFALNGMVFSLPAYLGMEPDFEFAGLFRMLTALFAALGLAVGGSYFIGRAWSGLRHGVLHIDLPIAVGVLAAFGGSLSGWLLGDERLIYFDFVAVFIFLMLVGRWVQEAALERNRNRLVRLDPKPASLPVFAAAEDALPLREAPAEEIEPGEIFAVAPGQLVPLGGRLLSPEAIFSLEWINGESEPREWVAQRTVPAGAINLASSAIRIEAEECWRDSLLSRLLAAPEQSVPRDRRFEAILRVYLCVILGLALLGGAAWMTATGDPGKALQVAISLLVVSCPCALGVAVPLCGELAVSRLRRCGLFVRTGHLWARILRLRNVVFDKTGTLTLEVPRLLDRAALEALEPDARRILAVLVDRSRHPVGRSLREELAATDPVGGAEIRSPTAIREEPGQGTWLEIAGVTWRLGRPDWHSHPDDTGTGRFDCRFSRNGKTVATFSFADELRADARVQIDQLQERGLAVAILSGDRPDKVTSLARELGIGEERALGRMSPDEKAEWIEAHDAERTLFVGDGANDSLAFDRAGCRGTPLIDRSVLESKADFYFVGRGLGAIGELFRTAERHRRASQAVFGFSITYNAIAGAVCLAGLMSPLLAAILMPLSSVASIAIVTAVMLRGTRRGVD